MKTVYTDITLSYSTYFVLFTLKFWHYGIANISNCSLHLHSALLCKGSTVAPYVDSG